MSVSIDLGEDRADTGVWKSGSISVSGAENISLHLTADFSRLGGYTGYVFDERGALVDTIPFGRVVGTSIWTEFAAGSSASIEIVGPAATNQTILVDEAVTEFPLGAADVLPDGVANFENADDVSMDLLSDDDRAATARLIIGQNSFPIAHRVPSRTPDWCTGVMISPNLLMTVSHCFRSRPELCKQTVALFGYDLGFPAPVSARSCVDLVYLNPFIDVVIVKLSPIEHPVQVATLAKRPPALNEQLLILQHPHGSVGLVSKDSSCVVTAPRAALRPSQSELDTSLLDALGFTHQCDTLEGSSGSPVFDTTGDVIGLHQGGEGQQNSAVRIDVVESCISIDVVEETVAVLKPGEVVCMNTL